MSTRSTSSAPPGNRRSRRRTTKLVAGGTAMLLALSVQGLGVGPATAAGPVSAGLTITPADLSFILKQIQISEAHATKEGATPGTVRPPNSVLSTTGSDGSANAPHVVNFSAAARPAHRGRAGQQPDRAVTTADQQRVPTAPAQARDLGAADRVFPRMVPAQNWRTPRRPRSRDRRTSTAGAATYLRRAGERRCRTPPARHQQPGLRPVGAATRQLSTLPGGGVGNPDPAPDWDTDGRLHPQPGAQQRPGGTDQLACSRCSASSSTTAWTSWASPAPRRSSSRCSRDDPLFSPAPGARNFIIANRTMVDRQSRRHQHDDPVDRPEPDLLLDASKQVFLREYVAGCDAGRPQVDRTPARRPLAATSATGPRSRRRPATFLGIQLVDTRHLSVPLLLTDEYGRFLRGANGFPQMVTDRTAPSCEGNIANRSRLPVSAQDRPRVPGRHRPQRGPGHQDPGCRSTACNADRRCLGPSGTYDDELLDAHFITGDGRGNENIGLTAIHTMFHSEHNRLRDDIYTHR